MDEPKTIWPRASWQGLLALGLGSRVLLLCLGMLAPLANPQSPLYGERMAAVEAELDTPPRRPLRPWYRWDALWYLEVARRGYEFDPDRKSGTAFMPLLPLCMAAGSAAGLDIFWVGWLVPNLAFAVGLVAFGRIAARLTGDDGVAWRSCLLLIAFPTSFFFSAPYLESLGFAFSAWGVWAWVERRPALAAANLGLATAARLACIAPSVAIGVEWLDDLAHRRKPRPWALPVAAAGAIGLVCFCLYLGFHVGDPLAHFKSHRLWGRKPGLGGLAEFARSFYSTARESRAFSASVVVLFALFGYVWYFGRLPSLLPPLRGRLAKVVPPLLVAIGALVVCGAFNSPPGSLPDRILAGLNERDYLAFLGFLGLGVSIWIRRGPFWGSLVLVPIALAATSGSSMSLARVILMSYPAFIEAAELLGRRWSFAAALLSSIAGQYYLFVRFSSLDGVIV